MCFAPKSVSDRVLNSQFRLVRHISGGLIRVRNSACKNQILKKEYDILSMMFPMAIYPSWMKFNRPI